MMGYLDDGGVSSETFEHQKRFRSLRAVPPLEAILHELSDAQRSPAGRRMRA